MIEQKYNYNTMVLRLEIQLDVTKKQSEWILSEYGVENKPENLKYDNEVIELFLNGGQLILTEKFTKPAVTHLVRMPKGKFVEFNGELWEYIFIQNYVSDDVISIAGYKNGGLADVKQRTSIEYAQLCAPIYRARK